VPNFYKHLITGWTWSTNSTEWFNPHTFSSVCWTVNVFTYTYSDGFKRYAFAIQHAFF